MVDACKISHIEKITDPGRFKSIQCRVYASGRQVEVADKCEEVAFRIKIELNKTKVETQS